MTTEPTRGGLAIDPFAAFTRGITEPDPVRAALRSAGPIVQVEAPAGGPAWIVTEAELARLVLSHPLIAKDPALAPPGWDTPAAGLEPTAAEQPALTTLDGPAHAELRRAHAPLLSAKRIRAQSGRVHDIARDLLAEAAAAGVVDLMDGFTIRFPVKVLLDLLGIDLDHLDAAVTACRLMLDSHRQGEAVGRLAHIAATGLDGSAGLAAELRDRVPAGTTPQQLHYHLFTLIFAGQLTTDASLGFLVARMLAEDPDRLDVTADTVDDAAWETLREHPPAPYSLWRFTTAEVELAGTRVPAGSPILVDIKGVNTDPATDGPDLSFGAGPHYCIGAQLALLELRAVATVLVTDHPRARLAVPYRRLRQANAGGIQGTRLTSLPVELRPG